MRKVVIDTSFLIQMAQGPSPSAEIAKELKGFEIVVLEDVMEELRGLAGKTATKRSRAGRLALEYAQGLKRVSIVQDGLTDEKILDYAAAQGALVASLDKEILDEAGRRGIGTITLRGGTVRVSERWGSHEARWSGSAL